MGSGESLGNITGLRTFRVLRALKTVSIVPGKGLDYIPSSLHYNQDKLYVQIM